MASKTMRCKKAAPRARGRGGRMSLSTSLEMDEAEADRTIDAADVMDLRIMRRMSGGSSEGEGSDSDDDAMEEDGSSCGGVRLETRALSFTQVSRIYGRQRNMGTI